MIDLNQAEETIRVISDRGSELSLLNPGVRLLAANESRFVRRRFTDYPLDRVFLFWGAILVLVLIAAVKAIAYPQEGPAVSMQTNVDRVLQSLPPKTGGAGR